MIIDDYIIGVSAVFLYLAFTYFRVPSETRWVELKARKGEIITVAIAIGAGVAIVSAKAAGAYG